MRTDLSGWMLTDAIRSAALRGASVISMSLGGGCSLLCQLFTDFVTRMNAAAGFAANNGAILVAAAGNAGIDIGTSKRLPCTANNTICVGGTRTDLSNRFNFGSVVDIWAPGEGLLATPDPLTRALDPNDVGADELGVFNGTSVSAPFMRAWPR